VGTLLLHRHASAGERVDDQLRDRRRRLDLVGRGDARALPRALGSIPIQGIVSSLLLRCVESVMPLADATLVCTHGEVIERLFDGSVQCEKGGTWLIDSGPGHMRAITYVPPASASRRERRPSVVA
jgi:phosphohistidine phosphatase SixA